MSQRIVMEASPKPDLHDVGIMFHLTWSVGLFDAHSQFFIPALWRTALDERDKLLANTDIRNVSDVVVRRCLTKARIPNGAPISDPYIVFKDDDVHLFYKRNDEVHNVKLWSFCKYVNRWTIKGLYMEGGDVFFWGEL